MSIDRASSTAPEIGATPARSPIQARLQVAAKSLRLDESASFSLSHPKNYLGVPFAAADPRDTGALVMAHLAMPGEARHGAERLQLLTATGDLSPLGKRYIAAVLETSDVNTPAEALTTLDSLYGSPKRFIDALPGWAAPTQQLFAAHPVFQAVGHILAETSSTIGLTLDSLLPKLFDQFPVITRRWFLTVDTLPPSITTDVLFSPTISHLKSLLFNAGLLRSPGCDTSRHTASEDRWQLDVNAFALPTSELFRPVGEW